MQVVERLRSCEAACELLEKYNMSYQSESNWMDELDSKLRNLEELEAARAKEAWEKHVQAVQEKFRQAGENLDNLNKWIDQVEKEIARQENLSEDADSLKNQINAMSHIKTDVDDHNRPVNNTLDIIIELVETGADVLSASELNQLQAEGKRLKERYDFVSDNSDKLHKRMLSSMEELGKFRAEKGVFSTWMEKAYKVLEDKERQLANLNKLQGNTDGIKEFVSDVMTHGADLKFLTISGQKYVQLSKEYVACLNEFRSKVRSSALKQSDSQIAKEVSQVGAAYQELLARANTLADRFSRVGNKWADYNDAVERAKKWLGATEPKVSKMVSEPIGAEPKVVEDQLNRARALNNEIIANGKLIEDAKTAANALLGSLDDSQMSQQERRQIEQTPKELQDRYDALKVAMATLCGDLDTALGQSQGVQAALANIADWLDKMDEAFKNINKPASLIRDRLDEQIRQLKALQADVASQESGIQKMYQAAQEFVQSSKNVRESKKIESKVKEVQTKYQGLVKSVQARGVFLDEISIGLGHFTSQVESFDDWYMEMIEILESREMLTMDADECAKKVDEIARAKDKKKPEYMIWLNLAKLWLARKMWLILDHVKKPSRKLKRNGENWEIS
jgi:chromosome segregation ATPase